MGVLRDHISLLGREPKAPKELREQFKREIALSNSRRLKSVTWLIFSALAFYMLADYLAIGRAGTVQAHTIWTNLIFMRPVAMVACCLFIWLFGPLRSIADLQPRHYWIWKAYICFFMVYIAIVVGYVFPLKQSIGTSYIFLLVPSAFLAMTTRQIVSHLMIGMVAIVVALYAFVPITTTVKHQLFNAAIIAWVAYVVARVTYGNTFRNFMNRQTIEEKNRLLDKARAEAQAASEAKSDFLAAVSHEIRTPMNSILGMTEIALHTPLSSEQRSYIETARESALHLLDVINDILDFSRIEARKLRLISAHFDLPAVVNSAMKTVELQVEQKGVALEFELMTGTPRFLKGDPGRLRQVLINLLNNAIKFTDEGYIRVTVGPWTQKDDPQRPVGIRFSVKDSGSGVARNKIKTLFEAFTQVEGTTTRSYGGSGLGLAICRNLVELMGGTISVQSEVGKGSEFIFTARFAEGDPERAMESEMMAVAWNVPVKPARVLLVEDNPLNVKVEKLQLDRMGMQTTVAESGTEALMLLAEQEFDLVLMDLEMPGMDGYETTRRIRSGEGVGTPVRQPGIPILAVTAHALGDVRSRCEKIGMDGFVTKPVGFGDMGAAMRQVLGGDWREATAKPTPRKDGAPVLDLGHAATHLGVSHAEMQHLLPNAMAEIALKLSLAEKSVRNNTLREVALQAHTLKSVAASIGAEATRQAAVKLENASRRDDIERSLERVAQLRFEVSRLETAVAAL